jgi:hypothetical protein
MRVEHEYRRNPQGRASGARQRFSDAAGDFSKA